MQRSPEGQRVQRSVAAGTEGAQLFFACGITFLASCALVCGSELRLAILFWIKTIFSLIGSKGFPELCCSVSIWLLCCARGNYNQVKIPFLEEGAGGGAVQEFPSPSWGTALLALPAGARSSQQHRQDFVLVWGRLFWENNGSLCMWRSGCCIGCCGCEWVFDTSLLVLPSESSSLLRWPIPALCSSAWWICPTHTCSARWKHSTKAMPTLKWPCITR